MSCKSVTYTEDYLLGRLLILTAYKKLFDITASDDELMIFCPSLQSGMPLGNDRFKAEIESTLGCKVGQAHIGRPRKLKAVTIVEENCV